jgi:hypothetical protein
VTPDHAKAPPAAETHHTTVKKQQIHTNRKDTGVDVTPQKIAIRPAPLNEQFDLQRQRHMEVTYEHSNHINKASSYQTNSFIHLFHIPVDPNTGTTP